MTDCFHAIFENRLWFSMSKYWFRKGYCVKHEYRYPIEGGLSTLLESEESDYNAVKQSCVQKSVNTAAMN